MVKTKKLLLMFVLLGGVISSLTIAYSFYAIYGTAVITPLINVPLSDVDFYDQSTIKCNLNSSDLSFKTTNNVISDDSLNINFTFDRQKYNDEKALIDISGLTLQISFNNNYKKIYEYCKSELFSDEGFITINNSLGSLPKSNRYVYLDNNSERHDAYLFDDTNNQISVIIPISHNYSINNYYLMYIQDISKDVWNFNLNINFNLINQPEIYENLFANNELSTCITNIKVYCERLFV